MKPGKELDTLISKEIFKLEICQCDEIILRKDYLKARELILSDPYADHNVPGFFRFNSDNNCNYCGKAYIPQLNYSENLTKAFKILEQLKKEQINGYGIRWDTDKYTVSLDYMPNTKEDISFSSKSLPHAICIAALLHKGYTISHEDEIL